MCIDSCIAFVGPYAELDECPMCQKPRYDPIKLRLSGGRVKQAQQVFHTFPIGPQLQALWQHPDSARQMHYRRRRTEEIIEQLENNDGLPAAFDDIITGSSYLDAVRHGRIKPEDMVLVISVDGAQLYETKQSDCWVYIWIIVDIPPDHRYKKHHVLPGTVVPGPNKPKYMQSFFFPGFHHLAAIQKARLVIWDAWRDITFISNPFLILACADGPGLVCISNLIGHNGKNGCRMLCGLEGRRKPHGNHYYPVLLQPRNYDVRGCNHGDLHPADTPQGTSENYIQRLHILMRSSRRSQYESNRLNTGIVGPSILLGLETRHILGIPECFSTEIMHFSGANMAALFTDLWRGLILCSPTDDDSTWDWAVLVDDTWEAHGRAVAACQPYLPGSFDNPPRNPAEKINTHYKAREFITWLFGLAPALLYNVLPPKYWQNFCKFTQALQIMSQYSITPAKVTEAFTLFAEWELEFENLYYQRRADRIHFIRPCAHLSNHIAPECLHVGSPICSSQWTMERTFADIEFDLRQPKLPYACLTQVCLIRCQINAVKAMFPHLQPPSNLHPWYSFDVGDGCGLLQAREKRPRYPDTDTEKRLISEFLGRNAPKMYRWSRLQLPNGQVARSAWKEALRPPEKTRMSRNVKVLHIFIMGSQTNSYS